MGPTNCSSLGKFEYCQIVHRVWLSHILTAVWLPHFFSVFWTYFGLFVFQKPHFSYNTTMLNQHFSYFTKYFVTVLELYYNPLCHWISVMLLIKCYYRQSPTTVAAAAGCFILFVRSCYDFMKWQYCGKHIQMCFSVI